MSYLNRHLNPQPAAGVPQSQPLDAQQVRNSAGGYTWEVDCFTRLRRFLVLGSEGGSYYASERKLTADNINSIDECIRVDGKRTVAEIVDISMNGRAPKNAPALLALALVAAKGDSATRNAAYTALPTVARTGTDLFQFLEFRQSLGGWGTGLRRAVARWYNERPIDSLAYQLIKYRQREGWTHRDVLRLAHVSTNDDVRNALYRWTVERDKPVKGDAAVRDLSNLPHEKIAAFEKLQRTTDPDEAAFIIAAHGLPREAVPTELLTQRIVWEALLEDMPMTALIRNLATLTRIGLLDMATEWERKVIAQLGNQDALQRARVHPITLLLAMRTYGAGHGMRGQNVWTPNPRIIDALDSAFYLAFQNVKPTGMRFHLALDVSGSMDVGAVAGVPGLTPREASVALALVTLAVEQDVVITGFSTRLMVLNQKIKRGMRLKDAVRAVSNLPFGGTDCAQPMLWAMQNKAEFDQFAVYTDNETWAGHTHPSQALQLYRQRTNIDARLAVVGMVSNGFTIADPNDRGMMDVVGFDSATPQIINEFAAGRI